MIGAGSVVSSLVDAPVGAWVHILCIVLATFISEDITCVSVGLLIHHEKLELWVGLLGCFIGIFLSDCGLWLLGRLGGAGLLRWKWVRRRLTPQRLAHLERWFDRNGLFAVLAARCVPGLRVPTYIAAGALGPRAHWFVLWALLACLVWTPLLIFMVILLGDPVVGTLRAWFGNAWVAAIVAAVVFLIAAHVVELLSGDFGRMRLWARLSRLWRWEFWPTWLFYLPLVPYLAYLVLRYRSVTLPTAANPGIPHGGVVGESKYEVLRRLPAEWVVPTELVPSAPAAERVATLSRVMQERGWTFPLILKPDASQRGAGLKRLGTLEQAAGYFERHTGAVLAQVYHPGPFEAGIFYYRMPGENDGPGRILSITDKQFPELVGDGRSTIEELIWHHPRYRMQADVFLARFEDRLDEVPAAGTRLALGVAGTHCQGTLCRDGGHLLTPELEAAVDRIARSFPGFYIGRFDVRYGDVVALKAGRGFQIVELNGVTSESTNVYDPSWSLLRAYRVLARQWALLFEIGWRNRQRGHRVTPLGELWADIRRYYRERRIDPLAD